MIFMVGDLHAETDSSKLSKKNFPIQSELKKEDILFQLGDFGWIWHEIGTNKNENYWLNWLGTRKYTLCVVPGNHENYDEIFKLPIIEKWGGKVRVLETKERFGNGIIYFLERGEIYTINNKTFFIFGGALSIDKEDRILGLSYWQQEIPSYNEFNYAMDKLDTVNWNVDYVLTHTCPINIISEIINKTAYTEGKFKDPVSVFLFEVYKNLKFREWHFGHFHVDKKLVFETNNEKSVFQCHYKNISELILN